jgi:tetratricopeptide (TPR) repeat protein
MSWPDAVKEEALYLCDRHCCLCGKECGINIELHHIDQKADGGPNTLENAIPLCFDCHAKVGHYNVKHPKGTKYSPNELRRYREHAYAKAASRRNPVPTPKAIRFGPIPQGEVIGRADLVAAIDANWPAHPVQVLVGGPGIGKSSVAALCVRAHEPAVVWLVADDASSLDSQLAAIAVTVGWASQQEPQQNQIAKAHAGLQDLGPALLLILDNVETPTQPQKLAASLPRARVLATTRPPLVPDGWHHHRVEELDERSARTLAAAKFAVPEDHPAIPSLGRHPQFITQSAAYAAVAGYTLAQFAEHWPDEKEAILRDFPQNTDPDLIRPDLHALITGSWNKTHATHPAAAQLLAALAWLRADGTARDLFELEPTKWPEPLASHLQDVSLRNKLYAAVLHSGLAAWRDEETLQPAGPESYKALAIHRAHQEVLRLHPPAQSALDPQQIASVIWAIHSQERHNRIDQWPSLRRVHAAALAFLAESQLDSQTAYSAGGHVAIFCRLTGAYVDALELDGRILQAHRISFGPAHPSTLASMNSLANSLQMMGDYEGARNMHREGLEARRSALGPAHPSTLGSMNNLAVTMKDMGDCVGARDMHQQCLEARRIALGPAHRDTLGSMNNLATTMQSMGDYEGALDMHQQCLEARRIALGPAHPDTLGSMNNLATTMQGMGDYEGALDMHQQCFETRRADLGPAHPDTLASMNNLANTLRLLHSLDEAEAFAQASIDGLRKVLGETHPYTQNTGRLLAAIRQARTSSPPPDSAGPPPETNTP